MRDKTKYIEYMNSESWKIKREEAFWHRWRFCQKCWSTEYLQVHHGTYNRIFKEKLADLFVLCNQCHFRLHEKYGNKDLLRATKSYIKWIELVPRKKKKRLPLAERKRRREERKLEEIPKAMDAIKNGVKFKQSWVSSIKNWRIAVKMIKESIS